jgi:hypothetical protein
MVKNQEDVKDLLNKLHEQQGFIQDKTNALTDSRFRPSRNSIQGLVKSLEAYILFVVFLNVDSLLIAHTGNWIPFKASSNRLTPKTRVEFESSFTRCLLSILIEKRLIVVANNWMDPSSSSWSVPEHQYFRWLIHPQNSVTFFIADQTAELYALQSEQY